MTTIKLLKKYDWLVKLVDDFGDVVVDVPFSPGGRARLRLLQESLNGEGCHENTCIAYVDLSLENALLLHAGLLRIRAGRVAAKIASESA